jgi:hypothetical protein
MHQYEINIGLEQCSNTDRRTPVAFFSDLISSIPNVPERNSQHRRLDVILNFVDRMGDVQCTLKSYFSRVLKQPTEVWNSVWPPKWVEKYLLFFKGTFHIQLNMLNDVIQACKSAKVNNYSRYCFMSLVYAHREWIVQNFFWFTAELVVREKATEDRRELWDT